MSSSAPVARLSCEQCQRRKVKCDKLSPCTACRSTGVACNTVQRARRPRGKSAKPKEGEIDARVARLEDLVKQLKAQVQPSKEDMADENRSPNGAGSTSGESTALPNYVAPGFWEALSQEASGIRDILEDGEDAETPSDAAVSPPVAVEVTHCSAHALLFNHNTSNGVDQSQILTKEMTNTLISVYRYRVDNLCKLLHWPSVVAVLEQIDTSVLNGPALARALALRSAIYFSAVCALHDYETNQLLGYEKNLLVNHLRLAAESSLSGARLLDQPDLMVLQAFIIYLIGLRCLTTSAASWTLFAVAVRLASALNLGSEEVENRTFFDMEIRRRVWFSMGTIDAQMAMDRGSQPLLLRKSFAIPPLKLNDEDLYPGCPVRPESETFTDMTMASMTHRAMMCQKTVEAADENGHENDWNARIAAIQHFEDYVNQQISSVSSASTPLQQFMESVGIGALINIKLMLRRPPFRSRVVSVPASDNFDILTNSTQVLEWSIHKRQSGDFAPWEWFAWVKWYALAVLLAELCGPCQGPAVDHAHVVAQKTFVNYAKVVADSESGMLWRPIAKLMAKVQKLRGTTFEGLHPSASIPGTEITSVGNGNTTTPEAPEMQTIYSATGFPSQALPAMGVLNPWLVTNDNIQNGTGYTGLEDFSQMNFDPSLGTDLSWVNWESFMDDINSGTMDWTNTMTS